MGIPSQPFHSTSFTPTKMNKCPLKKGTMSNSEMNHLPTIRFSGDMVVFWGVKVFNQLLPSDLLITQMEVTFSPLKRSLKTPKRVTGKNLVCHHDFSSFFGLSKVAVGHFGWLTTRINNELRLSMDLFL